MSVSRAIYDPFYEFERLFDEAFAARTSGDSGTQVAERNAAPKTMRPR